MSDSTRRNEVGSRVEVTMMERKTIRNSEPVSEARGRRVMVEKGGEVK